STGQPRPQIGPADPDVHHVADTLAGVALPLAAANAVGKIGHAVENFVNFRHHVLAIDVDGGIARRAQRHVQHGAVFGDVDLVAAEHGVDFSAQAALFRHL